MDQAQIDELLPSEAQNRAAARFIESCEFSTTALIAFGTALREQGQPDLADLIGTIIEEFAAMETGE